MIDNKELRIGNLVHHHVQGHKLARSVSPIVGCVTGIQGKTFMVDHRIPGVQAKPIRLTEKWLLRFGFVRERGFFNPVYFSSMIQCFMPDERVTEAFEETVRLWDPGLGRRGRPIIYVHDLQNTYFFLAGMELPINFESHV